MYVVYINKDYFFGEKIMNSHTNIPEFLFKYRCLDEHDISSLPRLKEIIVDKKIYFSSIKDFNDPFEFEHKLTLNAENSDKKIRFIKNQIDENPKLFGDINLSQSDKEIISAYEEIISSSLSNFSQYNTHEARNKSDFGIFCLSRSFKNINLWSHYANSHKGVCIKFQVIKNRNKIIKVEYTSDPSISIYDVPKQLDYYKQVSKLKWNEFWMHEEEYRLIGKTGHHYIDELGFKIDSIYLGINFYENKLALNFIEQIKDIIDREKINVLKARKSKEKKYCIEFDEISICSIETIFGSFARTGQSNQ